MSLDLGITNGQIRPVSPMINNVFEILLPKILPKTTVVSFFKLAIILTTTSGNDVPIDTKVSPIINSEILKRRAICVALSTTKLPPSQIKMQPRIKSIKSTYASIPCKQLIKKFLHGYSNTIYGFNNMCDTLLAVINLGDLNAF